MKFTTVAATIAAVVVCSAVVEAAPAKQDKKCHDQDMFISAFKTIQCGSYQIKNTCDYEARILQPNAGNWIDELHAGRQNTPRTIGCFTATKNK